MRRIAMIGLAMLVASCSITQTERGEAEVTFVYATGTRAELADAVDCLMPQRLRLTLTDENGRYYYIDPEHITQIETLPTYGYTGWQEGEIE